MSYRFDVLTKSYQIGIPHFPLHASQLSIFDSGALVINILYIKASLTINTSSSKMKFIWFFFGVISSASSFNITLSAMEYDEIRTMLHADMNLKHAKTYEKHHPRYTHLRRNNRDFTNTIDKIPNELRNELVQHQRFVHQTQMCNQAPCQKMNFIVSYQVKQSMLHKLSIRYG